MSQGEPVRVFLHRTSEDKYGTHGVLKSEDGAILCYTIERPWLDNQSNISCIPEGLYECIPHDSGKHPATWEVTNVPGRQAILIHLGNTMDDVHGCIAVGAAPAPDGVLLSRAAMSRLHKILPSHFMLEIFSGE